MAGYKKQHTDGPNSEDKALDLFAEMMIEKIESIRKDWRKPWFTEEALQWPCNLSGREYNGMNAIMLLIHCEKEGYKIPRFCTSALLSVYNGSTNPIRTIRRNLVFLYFVEKNHSQSC